MRSSATVFPDQIDKRIYWSDINLTQTDVMAEYQTKLSEGDYDGASAVLNNSDVFYYGAWLINMFRNKMLALEDYSPNLKQSIANIYSAIEPTSVTENIFVQKPDGSYMYSTVWIEDKYVRSKKADMSGIVTYTMIKEIDDETIDNLFGV